MLSAKFIDEPEILLLVSNREGFQTTMLNETN